MAGLLTRGSSVFSSLPEIPMWDISGVVGGNLPLTVAGAVPALTLARRTVFPFSPHAREARMEPSRRHTNMRCSKESMWIYERSRVPTAVRQKRHIRSPLMPRPLGRLTRSRRVGPFPTWWVRNGRGRDKSGSNRVQDWANGDRPRGVFAIKSGSRRGSSVDNPPAMRCDSSQTGVRARKPPDRERGAAPPRRLNRG